MRKKNISFPPLWGKVSVSSPIKGEETSLQRGFILLLTLVLMAALSAAVGALILSLTTDFRNVKVRAESTKAFYLAEAGVADTIKRLKGGELVVNDGSSTTFNGALGEGTYSETITRSGDEYTIASTGTFGTQSRNVTTTVTGGGSPWPEAFDYAVFGPIAGSTLSDRFAPKFKLYVDSQITGDVYWNKPRSADSVSLDKNSKVIGTIYTDKVNGTKGNYTWTKGVYPNPLPAFPEFDAGYFNGLISQIEENKPPESQTNINNQTLNLNGEVHYYSQFVANNSQIAGPGAIVADSITIHNGSNVVGDVQLVSNGWLRILGGSTPARTTKMNGGFIFSNEIVRLDNSNVDIKSTIRALQLIVNDSKMKGIVFADLLEVTNNGEIRGSVLTKLIALSPEVQIGSRIIHDPSVFPDNLPTGFAPRASGGGGNFSQVSNSWKES